MFKFKEKYKSILGKVFVLIFISVLILPSVSLAIVEGDGRIVPCGYDGARASGGKFDVNVPLEMRTNPKVGELDTNEQCNFYDFVAMINIIIIGTIMMASTWAAISFMYAGYAYLTSGGSQEKIGYAKGIFKKVLIGYIIILSAWGFVKMFEDAMLKSDIIKNNSFLSGNRK